MTRRAIAAIDQRLLADGVLYTFTELRTAISLGHREASIRYALLERLAAAERQVFNDHHMRVQGRLRGQCDICPVEWPCDVVRSFGGITTTPDGKRTE